jgi:hypothetical protein
VTLEILFKRLIQFLIKKTELSIDDLKKAISVPPSKITPEELLKSLPPNKTILDDIKSNDLFKTDLQSIKAEDLMNIVNTIPPSKITPEELLKSLPPVNTIGLTNTNSPEKALTTEELLKSLSDSFSSESNIKANDLLSSIKEVNLNTGEIDHNNLSDIIKLDDNNFFDKTPTSEIDNKTQEMKVDDLMSALMSEASPLKLSEEEETILLTDLMSEPTPLKSSEGENSDLMKDLEINIKTTKPVTPSTIKKDDGISVDDLLKALNGDN